MLELKYLEIADIKVSSNISFQKINNVMQGCEAIITRTTLWQLCCIKTQPPIIRSYLHVPTMTRGNSKKFNE